VTTVGFIGAGHIARALAEGWSRPGLADPPALLYFDIDAGRAAELAAACGGAAAADLVSLVAASDLVLVAVRPQHVEGVLAQVAPVLGDTPLVSVAAGVSLARVSAAVGLGSRVARVMPNVAAALGLGTFLLVPGTLGEARHGVEARFAQAGEVFELDEELFDAATSVAGCMPGILGRLVMAVASAGVEHGLAPDVADRLAVSGVHGAAAIIAREGDPAAVVTATATPGGMTAAAIEALEERELKAAVHAAVAAATARAKELA
jgi:pyrroline-5-carboxylate reductase